MKPIDKGWSFGMTKTKLAILVSVIVVAVVSASDAQQTRQISEQLRLASVMPGRAMLYIQANDLSALMKRWIASPVRDAYYKSDSFRSFSNSHAWLKLQDRKKDFESGLGFGIDEQRLSEIAGGPSAIAVYDIGKVEIVFVTELSRPRAIASAFFKQQSKFEERSADGTSYYVRDVTTDGGRLNQQLCFAYVDGRFIVTSAEGLIIRALANIKAATEDSMGVTIVKAGEAADGFAAHDITMWLDQARLNESRHFRNYWIHGNLGELAFIESGLIDLKVSGTGLNERRWFKLKSGTTREAELAGDALSGLLRFAPADSQMVDIHGRSATPEDLGRDASDVLFGQQPEAPPEPRDSQMPSSSGSSDNESSSSDRTQRYGHLDNRFDTDVDDPDARGKGSQTPNKDVPKESIDEFEKRFSGALAGAEPAAFCAVSRSRLEQGRPFVHFDKALIIELRQESKIDRAAIEKVILDEFRSRFVVTGSENSFGWEEAGGARFVAQSLMDRGAAYGVSGRYLIIASSKDFAADVLKAASTKPAAAPGTQSLTRYAVLRVADAKPMFDALMSKLDRTPGGEDSEENQRVTFFKGNLGSLVGALSFRQVEFSQTNAGDLLRESLNYTW